MRQHTNLASSVFSSQITGRSRKSLRQLPKGVLSRLQTLDQNIALLGISLEDFFVCGNIGGCAQVVQLLSLTFTKNRVALHRQNCELFVLLSADTLILNVLFSPFSHWKDAHGTILWIVRRDCLNILQELCNKVLFYKEVLAARREFLTHLFSMMTNRMTFEVAVSLAEEILALREDTLDVQNIPDFINLVHNFSSRQLASFCRVLAMVVFEPEDRPCEGHHKAAEHRGDCIVDINHDFILSVPNILVRLVKLLQPHKLKYYHEHQMEIMFVLCALCRGKKKEQVQNRLAELGLVEVLAFMFNNLDWKSDSTLKNLGVHGPDCLCDPETALKIQYLRLIHNFCDRDSCNEANKRLLMIPVSPAPQGAGAMDNNRKPAIGSCLIVKIIDVLMQEPGDSPYRFWLASCVEAFLRGARTDDQDFVAATGIMEHLVSEILKGGLSCPTSLQVNFDLLGELIKFNRQLFSKLNQSLVGEKFSRFIEVLVMNLIDSNVFIRSVLLSFESFKPSGLLKIGNWSPSFEKYGNYVMNEANDMPFCRISSFVARNLLRLLCDLMCAVQIGDINQDNICVLNTALIFLLFAERNNQLQTCLQHFKTGTQKSIAKHFRSLLEFWQGYYLRKRRRDCVSLEYNTDIPFTEWTRVVDMLYSEPDSPFSASTNEHVNVLKNST